MSQQYPNSPYLLHKPFEPAGDQPNAIDKLTEGVTNGEKFQTYFPQRGEGDFPTLPYNSSRYVEYENGNSIDSVFVPHDIVTIKFSQIDEPALKFWRSLIRQFGSNGNPFQEPLNIVSNINGGYGGWTGYGAVYYKIPIIDGFTTSNLLPLDSVEITDLF